MAVPEIQVPLAIAQSHCALKHGFLGPSLGTGGGKLLLRTCLAGRSLFNVMQFFLLYHQTYPFPLPRSFLSFFPPRPGVYTAHLYIVVFRVFISTPIHVGVILDINSAFMNTPRPSMPCILLHPSSLFRFLFHPPIFVPSTSIYLPPSTNLFQYFFSSLAASHFHTASHPHFSCSCPETHY